MIVYLQEIGNIKSFLIFKYQNTYYYKTYLTKKMKKIIIITLLIILALSLPVLYFCFEIKNLDALNLIIIYITLLSLLIYTFFTFKVVEEQEILRKKGVEPFLTLYRDCKSYYMIRNIGNGPAITTKLIKLNNQNKEEIIIDIKHLNYINPNSQQLQGKNINHEIISNIKNKEQFKITCYDALRQKHEFIYQLIANNPVFIKHKISN